MKGRLEEKLSNQKIYPDMEKVFEPSNQQEKEITKGITSENEDLGKVFLRRVEKFNQRTQRNNEVLSNLFKSNAIDSSVTTNLASLMKSSNRSQFSLTQLKGNRFIIIKLNPQNVILKGSTLTTDNGNRYDLNIFDLSYFLSNTIFDK